MKSPLLLALVATLLLAPTACGGGVGSKVDDADATATAAAAASEGGEGDAGADASLPVSGTLAADSAVDGPPQATPNATVEKLAETFTLPELGEADAPLVIMEFSDYRCPYCKDFFEKTMPDLRKNWIETGKARLQFYDLPLTSHGFPAVVGAESAHCAGEQGEYWTMHDALFSAFDDLTEVVDVKIEDTAISEILKVGKQAGLDMDKLTECVESKRYRPIVAELADTALERDINGTPWFILLAKDHAESIPGYVDYATMLPILEREYSRALGTPIPTDTPAPATPTAAVSATAAATAKP